MFMLFADATAMRIPIAKYICNICLPIYRPLTHCVLVTQHDVGGLSRN